MDTKKEYKNIASYADVIKEICETGYNQNFYRKSLLLCHKYLIHNNYRMAFWSKHFQYLLYEC